MKITQKTLLVAGIISLASVQVLITMPASVSAEPQRKIPCKDGTVLFVTALSKDSNDKVCKDHGGAKTTKSSPASKPSSGTPLPDSCGGVETSIIKCSQTNSGGPEDNAIWGLLIMVLNILTAGVGIVAVGGLVYASILYASAADDAAQMKKAKDTIVNVVIGIVAFALMYSFLQFIIPGGVFS